MHDTAAKVGTVAVHIAGCPAVAVAFSKSSLIFNDGVVIRSAGILMDLS